MKKMKKIAFINGYLTALQADEETIKKLKEDKDFLKNSARKEANNYLMKVGKLSETATKMMQERPKGNPSPGAN